MQQKNESIKQPKKWYKKWWGIILLITIGIPAAIVSVITFIAIIYGITSSINSRSEESPEEKSSEQEKKPADESANYEINIAGNTYASTSERRVTFTVANIGDIPSTPSCYVEVKSPDNNYIGYDYIEWNTPVEPGDRKYFEGLIIVTGEGAAYATKVEVSCS